MPSKIGLDIQQNSTLIEPREFAELDHEEIGITVLDGDYFGYYMVYKLLKGKLAHTILTDRVLARRLATPRRVGVCVYLQ